MHCKHLDILWMWMVVTLLACGLAAPSRSWAQDGFALGEPVRLTLGQSTELRNQRVELSPDGTKIILVGYSPDGKQGNIWKMNVDGTNPVQLTANLPSERGPQIYQGYVDIRQWSPDGTKIAFRAILSDCPRLNNPSCFYARHSYVMNADGTNLITLNNPSSPSFVAWSPDSTHMLVHIRSESHGEGFFRMNADGTNPVLLLATDPRSTDGSVKVRVRDFYDPIYSPDGSKIALRSSFLVPGTNDHDDYGEAARDLYVMNADGTGLTQLTRRALESGGTERNYAWSPSGTNILYSHYNGPQSIDVYVINADGTNPVKLTRSPEARGNATWSPDGTQIAFPYSGGGSTGIAVMSADGTNLVRLPYSGYLFSPPRWSPDGTKIAFSYTYRDTYHLRVMNADGTNSVQLTRRNSSSSYSHFRWSSDGRKIFFTVSRVVAGLVFASGELELYVTSLYEAPPPPTEHSDTRDEATVVAPDSTTAGDLERRDVDYFQIDVTEPGRLTVETTGTTDTVGYLQGAQGQTLAGDDNAGAETNFRIGRDVTPGTYYVAVVGGDGRTATGGYTLEVRFTASGAGDGGIAADHGDTRERATPVGVNTQTGAALERAGDVDYFRVEVARAGRLTVETTGTTDTVGYLGGAGGGWLEQDDASGPEANFRIGRDVTPGMYYVAVVGGKGRTATGAYTLDVRLTAGGGAAPAEHGNTRAHATQVDVNTDTAGALEQRGDVDYFRVTLPQAGTLTVETTGDTDTVGYVGGADGRWLSRNDDREGDVNFRIVRQVAAGTYYVAVVGGAGRTATGAYTFHARFTAAGAAADHGNTRERATRVDVDTQTEGALDRAGDVDYFRVAVPGAGRLTVETTGTTDTFGYVGGAAGGWLAQDDDSGMESNFRIVRDVESGTYYVAVVGKNRTATGLYTLAVRFAAE